MWDQEKSKAIESAMTAIHKQFGKGAIMRMDDSSTDKVPTVSSGNIAIDLALGGGIPYSRVIEIYGPESSGKTTLALHIIAEIQKIGKVAAFIDAEHALDLQYAGNLGVKKDELLLSQPDCGEQALEIAEILVRSGGVNLIVVDSVAALTPRAEINGEMGDSHMGLQARLMSQALRKLTPVLHQFNCSVIFINQLRSKIGVVFGNPETTTGGNALKFYSTLRIDVRKAAVIKKGDEVIGNRTRLKVVKNKIAPPFKTCEYDVLFGKGITKVGTLLDIGLEIEVIQKSGSWYSYEGERIAQGREKAIDFFENNQEATEKLENTIREKYNLVIETDKTKKDK